MPLDASASEGTGAADSTRHRGARAVERYPMTLEPGQGFMVGELFVGTRSALAAAGAG